MSENLNEITKGLKDSNGEEPDQVKKSLKSAFWYKKPYSAEAEVKKLKKQLQEKKERIRKMKKTEKELYRTIWEQDELIEKLQRGLEEVGRDIGDITAKVKGDVTGTE
ncbi:MAG: hypothetical protein ACLP9S_04630 [Syntrophales bacterium]